MPVDTGSTVFDNHLISNNWFDADAYPTITFKSTGFKFKGDKLEKLMTENAHPLWKKVGDHARKVKALVGNGGLSLLDPLWMGVPVVTLAGDWAGARQGASLLHTLGLPQSPAGAEPGTVVGTALGTEVAIDPAPCAPSGAGR